MGFECLEEIDDFFLPDTAFVQTEQAIGARNSCDDRNMSPIEVKLNDGRLTFGCPRTHSGWTLAEAGLVDKDDQTTFAPGFFSSMRAVRAASAGKCRISKKTIKRQ